MAKDYNSTLNLPVTDFPMRASLPTREPVMLDQWLEEDVYKRLMEKNEGKPKYILHDGPPYANGDIHTGHALNKILKDFIVRYKNISGFKSPYVPGWDTHGLPTELKALKTFGVENVQNPLKLREHCRDFAMGYVNSQREQFLRLGVIGDYDDPYITLKPEFEARQIEIFGEMAKKGYIYKGMKPVYWCPDCVTALAEAEIEYDEDPCFSIYVKFNVKDDKGKFTEMGIDKNKVSFVIWTTTTWTLPANVAICLGGNYEYSIIKTGDEYLVIATDLVPSTMAAAKIEEYESVGIIRGTDFEYMTASHPFIDRDSLIILGDHVTLESGTGCVHTAPGHGVDDFYVGLNYDLPIVVPVDDKGILTEEAGMFAGLSTENSGKEIAQHLENTGHLFAIEKIIHQYPHCWRCKEPIIFRATDQWFCSIDGFKDRVLEVIKDVEWIPGWGQDRMSEMVISRADWCISRQRLWGVPIPIFYCDDCGKYIVNDDTIGKIADLFRKEGSDAWFKYDAGELLPDGFTCPHCGGNHFTKEKDIMDVWFDSGTTHASVLKDREDQQWPADLYLEGSDQYRGWFQSSMLTAVAALNESPYKAVCTHGWVVDGEGKKMSKSQGNGVEPAQLIKEFGADILRLWVASSDYHADVRISKEIFKQLSEVYRKIRNTARYILGNINDFDPKTMMVDYSDLHHMDLWILGRLNALIEKVQTAYEKFEFHIIFHSIHNFCVVDLSNFYLDVLKDRLYVEGTDSNSRRSAQTTIYLILNSLTRMFSPIIPFTADEIWKAMPHFEGEDLENVIYNMYPTVLDIPQSDLEDKYSKMLEIREVVNKALETARAEKTIGSSLEADVTVFCSDDEIYDFIKNFKELAEVFIVSKLDIQKGTDGAIKGELENISVTVKKAAGEKCERCWSYSETVGADSEHPTLCSRCLNILK